MIRLRRMIESDVNDYVRWFTSNTEWKNWDAPWEKEIECVEVVRKYWNDYYNRHRNKDLSSIQYRFEIEDREGNHIGWVSSYNIQNFLEYFDNKTDMLAIGIVIPEIENRRRGSGQKAYQLFMGYLKDNGITEVYTQTWSGNTPMINLALKVGFTEIMRIKKIRNVNGILYDALTFIKHL